MEFNLTKPSLEFHVSHLTKAEKVELWPQPNTSHMLDVQ
jgi:hypothetical protein